MNILQNPSPRHPTSPVMTRFLDASDRPLKGFTIRVPSEGFYRLPELRRLRS